MIEYTSESKINILTKSGFIIQDNPIANKETSFFVNKEGQDYIALFLIQKSNSNSQPFRKIDLSKVQQFADKVSKNENLKGIMISPGGFTPSASTAVSFESDISQLIELYRLNGESLIRLGEQGYDEENEAFSPVVHSSLLKRIAVYTEKGGTGKTTVAAHTACIFAMTGLNTVLCDVDPQKNLTAFFPNKSIYVRAKKQWNSGIIDIVDYSNYLSLDMEQVSRIIFDFSPFIQLVPNSIINELDLVVMPTTLTPSGVSTNFSIVKRTLNNIREHNKNVNILLLFNMFDKSNRYNNVLIDKAMNEFSKIKSNDNNFHFYNPFELSIPKSAALSNWGIHIVDSKMESSPLAFFYKGQNVIQPYLKLLDVINSFF